MHFRETLLVRTFYSSLQTVLNIRFRDGPVDVWLSLEEGEGVYAMRDYRQRNIRENLECGSVPSADS